MTGLSVLWRHVQNHFQAGFINFQQVHFYKIYLALILPIGMLSNFTLYWIFMGGFRPLVPGTSISNLIPFLPMLLLIAYFIYLQLTIKCCNCKCALFRYPAHAFGSSIIKSGPLFAKQCPKCKRWFFPSEF